MCSSLLFYYCDKTLTKSTLGEEAATWLTLPDHRPSLKAVRAGT